MADLNKLGLRYFHLAAGTFPFLFSFSLFFHGLKRDPSFHIGPVIQRP
jgi:hypothetical protein